MTSHVVCGLTGLSWAVFLLNKVSPGTMVSWAGTSKMAYLMASGWCWLLLRAHLGCVRSTWALIHVTRASHSITARFRGKKQKLPALLRPEFISPRTSFLWAKQSSPSNPFSQFSSVTQSCPTLCDPMDCSTPGHPIHHQLLEFTQTHVH